MEGNRVIRLVGLWLRCGGGETPRVALEEFWGNVGEDGEAGASALGLEICKGALLGSLSRDVEERRLDALGLTGLTLLVA